MRIYLDPRDESGKIIVGILRDGRGGPEFFEYDRQKNISILGFLKSKVRFLANQGQTFGGIVAVPGPGTFSSVRSTAVFANLFAFAAGVPIVSIKPKTVESANSAFLRGIEKLKKGEISERIDPLYSKPPNITKSKCG